MYVYMACLNKIGTHFGSKEECHYAKHEGSKPNLTKDELLYAFFWVIPWDLNFM